MKQGLSSTTANDNNIILQTWKWGNLGTFWALFTDSFNSLKINLLLKISGFLESASKDLSFATKLYFLALTV